MKRNWTNRSRRSHGQHNGGSKADGRHSPNRVYESVGPEVKLRGKAEQVYRKYQDLARDAQLAGDGVRAEALLQHGEHYYRMMDEAGMNRAQQADAAENGGMTGDTPSWEHTDMPKHDAARTKASNGTASPADAQDKLPPLPTQMKHLSTNGADDSDATGNPDTANNQTESQASVGGGIIARPKANTHTPAWPAKQWAERYDR